MSGLACFRRLHSSRAASALRTDPSWTPLPPAWAVVGAGVVAGAGFGAVAAFGSVGFGSAVATRCSLLAFGAAAGFCSGAGLGGALAPGPGAGFVDFGDASSPTGTL